MIFLETSVQCQLHSVYISYLSTFHIRLQSYLSTFHIQIGAPESCNVEGSRGVCVRFWMVCRNNSGMLGCWFHHSVLSNTLAGWVKKNVVSMSRIDPVRIYNAPSLVCLIANIVHLGVVWCMKRGMVSSESILC